MPNASKSKYRKVSVGYLSIDRSGDVDQSKLPKTAAAKIHYLPIVSSTRVRVRDGWATLIIFF